MIPSLMPTAWNWLFVSMAFAFAAFLAAGAAFGLRFLDADQTSALAQTVEQGADDMSDLDQHTQGNAA